MAKLLGSPRHSTEHPMGRGPPPAYWPLSKHGRRIVPRTMPNATLPAARRDRSVHLLLLFLVLLAAMLTQLAWYYPQLPERMAAHFNFAGQADSFMPKQTFLSLHLGLMVMMSVIFLGVPSLIVRLPPGLINLPNKKYWLAPERHEHTTRVLQGYLVAVGDMILLFLLIVFREVMRASLMPEPHLSNRMWVMLVLLAGFVIVWTVRFMRAFRLPT